MPPKRQGHGEGKGHGHGGRRRCLRRHRARKIRRSRRRASRKHTSRTSRGRGRKTSEAWGSGTSEAARPSMVVEDKHVLVAYIIHVLKLARVLHLQLITTHSQYCSGQCVLSSPLSWQHTCPSPYSRQHSQMSLVATRTLRAFLLSFSAHASSPHSTVSMVLPFLPPQMMPSTDTSNFCLFGHLFLTMMVL